MGGVLTSAGRKLGAVALLGMALLLSFQASAQTRLSERARQKQEAEAERAGLQNRLATLKRDINRTEAARNSAADELAQSEKAISEANRELHELDTEQKQTEARIRDLTREQERLNRLIAARKKQLSAALRELHVTGGEDRLKLLLSGDNPNRINRDLQYMDYVAKAQSQLIATLREELQAVRDNRAEVEEAREALKEIAEEQQEQRAKLQAEKSQHAALLGRLSGKLEAQRREAGNIERDQQRLANLVEQLARVIEEQRRAEAAAAAARERERQKQAQLAQARAKAEAEAQARAKAREAKLAEKSGRNDKPAQVAKAPVNPDAIDADEPPVKKVVRNELVPSVNVQDKVFERAFASLRGQLRLPVRGELLSRFGSKRGDAPSSKGLFIRAAEGAEVRAVAPGRIVFAEWLRGFGNLIIVDHGSQYMTIYGNNQAVLKRAGDAVKGGDIIASAGSSGGGEQSGLYFEMRHQGRAFDPLDWVTTR